MKMNKRERFISKKIDINIDGNREVWEFEKVYVVQDEMFVKYKLKGVEKYETGV